MTHPRLSRTLPQNALVQNKHVKWLIVGFSAVYARFTLIEAFYEAKIDCNHQLCNTENPSRLLAIRASQITPMNFVFFCSSSTWRFLFSSNNWFICNFNKFCLVYDVINVDYDSSGSWCNAFVCVLQFTYVILDGLRISLNLISSISFSICWTAWTAAYCLAYADIFGCSSFLSWGVSLLCILQYVGMLPLLSDSSENSGQ